MANEQPAKTFNFPLQTPKIGIKWSYVLQNHKTSER